MMLRLTPLLVAGLLAAAPTQAQAEDWDALRNDPQISEGLIIFSIARRIHKRCPDISARRIRALGFINSLVGMAEDLGY